MKGLYFLLFFLLVLLIIFIVSEHKKGKMLKAYRKAYQDALNGNDKRKALIAGRAYYSYLRKGTLTIYDEQAINNDINTMKMDSKNNNEYIEQLERLANLKNQGILSEEEFINEKSKILNR